MAGSSPFTILTNIFVTANSVKLFSHSRSLTIKSFHLYFHVGNSCINICYIVLFPRVGGGESLHVRHL